MSANDPAWVPYDDGQPLGDPGTDGGRFVRDEEHFDGARITLEVRVEKRRLFRAPELSFAITCGICGWMVHTRFFRNEAAATRAFDEMKVALDAILAVIPSNDDPDVEARMNDVTPYIEAFIARFPT